MSPTSYTDELDGDGNPTGNRIAHAGRPIEYQISADDAVNGAFSLDFGGMESGSSYMLAVTPFALTDDSGSSYIYGATTATDVVEVPLVKMPVLHVASNLGAIASDSALGNVLAVNGDFELNIATTYIGAEDGQSRDLAAKFTVWQSDGTLDEATNMPNFTQIYASADYENHIAVPVTVDGDAGSSLIRIVAENDQGDVSEYGLAVRYSNLPPGFVRRYGSGREDINRFGGQIRDPGQYRALCDRMGQPRESHNGERIGTLPH
ncbi:hypothetical protein [Cohnella rhizosphaerae]|uniref:Uncharacterized protein n=1 Tax=Cohnella rhizosphaerae TaxID=1457232 RepID=A0A9X4L110_9BACL|nr:hypothetical protein [Cohnella rhizosphaerae]MDG0814156.1 hypothetical protein [Cohnella rhizosphaerae]